MEEIPENIKDAFIESTELGLEKVKKLKEMLHDQFPVSSSSSNNNNNNNNIILPIMF